ncbi:MAG: PD40 domain-containing protein, partial [Planctomycetales bacterium]|nr:PD40 domain-containing protein [Planctomycetales bacterium]
PLYMSPEQATLSQMGVDTRSDVYSLGVLLYELITGTTPIDRESAKVMSHERLLHEIADSDAPKPSRRISTANDQLNTIAEYRGLQAKQIRRNIVGDLDWIVMKALEKDRNRRYQSPRELADDLQRWLSGDVVEACPPSLVYLTRKYVKRHRFLLAAVGCVVLTAVTGSWISMRYAMKANTLAGQYKSLMTTAERDAFRAEQSATQARDAADAADQENRRAEAEKLRAENALYVSNIRLAAKNIESGAHFNAFQLLTPYSNSQRHNDLRGWEWYYLLDQSRQSFRSLHASHASVAEIDWSPDGKWIASASDDGNCSIWDWSTGELLKAWDSGGMLAICVRWSPDGNYLAWGSASEDQKVRIWNRKTDSVEEIQTTADSVWTVRWRDDGKQLLVGTIQGTSDRNIKNLFLYERQQDEWKLIWETACPANIQLAGWNHDFSLIGVLTNPPKLYFFDAQRLLRIQLLSTVLPAFGAFSTQSNRLAVSDHFGVATVFDLSNGSTENSFQAHFEAFSMRWSPDDRWLASCSKDGFVKVWDVQNGELRYSFGGHQATVNGLAWSPDSQRLASCGDDGQIRVWQLQDQATGWTMDTRPEGALPGFAWLDNDTIQFISETSRLTNFVFSKNEKQEVSDLGKHDGNWLLQGVDTAVLLRDRDLEVWRSKGIVQGLSGVTARTFEVSPDSTKIASQEAHWTQPNVKDLSGNVVPIGDTLFIDCRDFAWSQDAQLLGIVGRGTAGQDGSIRNHGYLYVVDPSAGEILHRCQIGPNRIAAISLAWSPDGTAIAAGTMDGYCEVISLPGLTKQYSSIKHLARVQTMDWHPDGNRIASGGCDRVVQVWDAKTGATLISFKMEQPIEKVSWSPDGTKLAAMDQSGLLQIWDGQSGMQYAESDEMLTWLAESINEELSNAIDREDWTNAAQVATKFLQLRRLDCEQSYFGLYAGVLANAWVNRHEEANQLSSLGMAQVESLKNSDAKYFCLWNLALIPDAMQSFDHAIDIARRVAESNDTAPSHMECLAALQFRAGRYEESLATFERAFEARRKNQHSTVYGLYLKAMAHEHLGQRETALATLEQANEEAEQELSTAPHWNRRLTIHLFRREAELLIRGQSQ